jgi:hypothetical protein
MSKQQYTTAFVIAGLIAILAIGLVATFGSTVPQAAADPRFPQPEFHCQGNPHSPGEEQSGNPHDFPGQGNPHDDVECTLNPHSPR